MQKRRIILQDKNYVFKSASMTLPKTTSQPPPGSKKAQIIHCKKYIYRLFPPCTSHKYFFKKVKVQ